MIYGNEEKKNLEYIVSHNPEFGKKGAGNYGSFDEFAKENSEFLQGYMAELAEKENFANYYLLIRNNIDTHIDIKKAKIQKVYSDALRHPSKGSNINIIDKIMIYSLVPPELNESQIEDAIKKIDLENSQSRSEYARELLSFNSNDFANSIIKRLLKKNETYEISLIIKKFGITPDWKNIGLEEAYARNMEPTESNCYSDFYKIDYIKEITSIPPSNEIIHKALKKCMDNSYFYPFFKLKKRLNIIPDWEKLGLQDKYAELINNNNIHKLIKLYHDSKIAPDLKDMQGTYDILLNNGNIFGFFELAKMTKINPDFSKKEIKNIYKKILSPGSLKEDVYYIVTEYDEFNGERFWGDSLERAMNYSSDVYCKLVDEYSSMLHEWTNNSPSDESIQ